MKKLSLLSFVWLSIISNALAQELDKEKLLDFYQSQKYAEAASYLASIYPNDTKDVKVLTQIAYCNMMSGKLLDAEYNYQKINQLQPHQITVLFSLANINARRGNKKNTIEYLQQVTNIDSNNFNAYKRLADHTDSLSLKLIYLKKANSINRTEADVATDLARIYRDQKDYQLSYNVLKTAIVADTSNMILQQALLPVANQLKKYKEVIAVGTQLLKMGADGNVVLDVGKAYFFLNDYRQAVNTLQLLEKMDLQNESVFYYLSLCHRELKNYDMAVNYAKKTIDESISPNITAYYSLLGGIYDSKKQSNLAIATYKKGLSYNTSKNIYYRLGLLYDINLKQFKTAFAYYRLYLKSKDLDESDKPQIAYVKSRLYPAVAKP